MLMYSNANACFEHSNFFKVKDLDHDFRRTFVPETKSRRMAKTATNHHLKEAGQVSKPDIQLRAF